MEFKSRNEKFKSKSSSNAHPIGSLILDLPPSCIEFVPPSEATPWAIGEPCFVVGTYDLQKEEKNGEEKEEEAASVPRTQSRQGSLSLFTLKNNNRELECLSTIATPSAILDLHFYKNTPWFAVASSTGTISIYRVVSATLNEKLERDVIHIKTFQILDEDEIITSFAWFTNIEGIPEDERPLMAVTSTTGAVKVLGFLGGMEFTGWELFNNGEDVSQHQFEAWYCAFSEKGDTIFSGGDDSKLIMSSLKPEEPSTRKLPFHNAGVTAILPISSNSSSQDTSILLTGSYDDFIRVYQLPSSTSTKPKILAEKDIGLGGGGVWRLKYIEMSNTLFSKKEEYTVLATCMRVGCKILKISKSETDDWTIEVLAHNGVHESMNYASDFVPTAANQEGEHMTIVSTSFYDRLLFVWRYTAPLQSKPRVEALS